MVEHESILTLKLDNPYTMIVSGQTGSGKTRFVLNVIRHNKEINAVPFKRIIYAYSVLQDILQTTSAEVSEMELHDGFPNIDGWTGEPTLLIVDDMMLELRNDVRLAELFTKMRHKNVSTIFITQNFYFQSQYATTISRNAHYIVLFQNPRDNAMIGTLGRQIFPANPKFLTTAFDEATDKPYGYILLDFKPTTPKDLRVRQYIFPGEQTYVYIPKP